MNDEQHKSSPTASIRRIDPAERRGQDEGSVVFLISKRARVASVTPPRRRDFIARAVVDLRSACALVLEALRSAANARGVTLEAAQFASRIWANETLLRRVLMAVVGYQIRRACPGSTITLMTTPLRGATEVRVIDWGSDCSSERIPREPHAAKVRLALEMMPSNKRLWGCELAIESQGGSIWYERSASGSVFYIRLPHGS
jgi:hypothetical protein